MRKILDTLEEEVLSDKDKSPDNQNLIENIRKVIWIYYHEEGRDLPWRNITDPYGVFVSEIMLQQTQVQRVLKKYPEFLSIYPTLDDLANAETHELLQAWQGMGYNRRALSLRAAAKVMVSNFGGKVPIAIDELEALPGIGPYTARAISTFAYNKPHVFIETNIRTACMYLLANESSSVHDKELLPFIEALIDHHNPREWYYAFMDYGTYVKKLHGNLSRSSKHYTKQSPFKGSDRELRGKILKLTLKKGTLTNKELLHCISDDPERVERITAGLVHEGFIKQHKGFYTIN
jgi:A/G-specific adenine glycosylase